MYLLFIGQTDGGPSLSSDMDLVDIKFTVPVEVAGVTVLEGDGNGVGDSPRARPDNNKLQLNQLTLMFKH